MEAGGTSSCFNHIWRLDYLELTAEFSPSRICRPVFRRASIVRKGGADARLARDQRRYPHLHSLPRVCPNDGPLGPGRVSAKITESPL